MAQIVEMNGQQFSFPDDTSDADISAALMREFESTQQPPTTGSRAGDIGLSAVKGANTLIPGLLGLPIDTATNLVNLGIAGFGATKGFLHKVAPDLIEDDLPETLDPSAQFGGSASFARGITQLAGDLGLSNREDLFAPVDPNDPLQRGANVAGTVLGSAAVSPASLPRTLASLAPAAAGAGTASVLFPETPLAPIVGALAPGAARAAIPQRARVQPKVTATRARELGYKVLPTSAKQTRTRDFAQAAAGTVPLKQKMSQDNQINTNVKVRRHFGLEENTPITADALGLVRAEAGQAYEAIKGMGRLRMDATYINGIRELKRPGALAKDFPGAVKKDVLAEADKFDVRQITAEGAVEALKQLRRDSDIGSISLDPATRDLARVQRKIADNLEGLLERKTKILNPQVHSDFVNARRTIAQTYQVQKALVEGDNVSAIALGKQLTKGKPFSGELRDIAEFGKNFKETAQPNPPQATNFRPMDFAIGILGGSVSPALAVAVFARPALRSFLLSKTGQSLSTQTQKLTNAQLKSVLKKPEEAQVTALLMLIRQGNESQELSPQ